MNHESERQSHSDSNSRRSSCVSKRDSRLVGHMSLVAEASNGREAVEQFRVHRPDITLMDLQMHEMDGLGALSAICAEFPEARVIILTTFTSDVQILRAMKLGARAYLVKSLLDKELLETIRTVHAGNKTLSAR